jgi:crotonobetainyl-CoA:carnitine CoA-transferase CaiB-like acyl-CoA transferase
MPVDMGTALNSAFAIAAALYRRSVTGEGQYLDVAMMDTAMVLQAPQVSNYLVHGVQPELFGNRSPTRQPTANVFATADGYLQVVALKEEQVKKLFDTLGLAERYSELPFSGADARVANTAAVNAVLSEAFAAQDTATWQRKLIAAGVPVAEIRSFAGVVSDPQFDRRNAFVDCPLPGRTQTRVVGSGYVASRDGPSADRPAPLLGQHTDEVLNELGYSDAAISELRERGVV